MRAALLSLWFSAGCFAAAEHHVAMLKDIGPMAVIVELAAGAPSSGFGHLTAQRDIELRLRGHGIPILQAPTPGRAFVYLNVNIVDAKDLVYAVNFNLRVEQPAKLSRESPTYYVITWAQSQLYLTEKLESARLREILLRMVDDLASDYMSVNKPEAEKRK